AYFEFADKYYAGKPIRIFNNGDFEHDLYRNFTYIDDIVEGMKRLIHHPPTGDVQHQVYNIGNHHPVKLMKFIETLEQALSKATGKDILFEKIFEPIKPGDVPD